MRKMRILLPLVLGIVLPTLAGCTVKALKQKKFFTKSLMVVLNHLIYMVGLSNMVTPIIMILFLLEKHRLLIQRDPAPQILLKGKKVGGT